MNKKYYFFIVLTIFFASACKEKEVTQPKVETKVIKKEIVRDTSPASPKPIIKEKPHYFLIAGCFEYIENANKLCAKLQKEGYPEAVVLPYYENLYLVAYKGYAQKTEARKALDSMKEANDKNVWLHHVK